MCLVIDKKLHTKKSNRAPRRAMQDILVYKMLRIVSRNGQLEYLAPYYHTPWVMNRKKRATMKVFDRDSDCPNVEQGLHSFANKSTAEGRCVSWSERRIFPAVIPKGSLVYFGEDNEIVSSSLIVYPDLKALTKARGGIGPGVAKKNIAI